MCGRQRSVLLRQFLEQPNVLDGDDGLVGEGLHEGDLRIGERLSLGTAKADRAYRYALSQQWNARISAEPELLSKLGALRKLVYRSLQIHHLNRLPIDYRASGDCAANRRNFESRRSSAERAMVGHRAKDVAVEPENTGVMRGTETCGALGHRIQHGL